MSCWLPQQCMSTRGIVLHASSCCVFFLSGMHHPAGARGVPARMRRRPVAHADQPSCSCAGRRKLARFGLSSGASRSQAPIWRFLHALCPSTGDGLSVNLIRCFWVSQRHPTRHGRTQTADGRTINSVR
jgi:hypothetical protein